MGPSPVIDPDCFRGCANALTYIVYKDIPYGYLQRVECCAYPGSGNESLGGDLGTNLINAWNISTATTTI